MSPIHSVADSFVRKVNLASGVTYNGEIEIREMERETDREREREREKERAERHFRDPPQCPRKVSGSRECRTLLEFTVRFILQVG